MAKTTQIEGSTLVPNFDDHMDLGVTTEHAYWMGVTPDCPAHQISCAGLDFPKMNERLIPDPNRTGKTVRVPVLGGLNKGVTSTQVEALRECLPRMVIRFTEEELDQKEEQGSGNNIGDVHVKVRKGYVITIPTAKQIKDAKKAKTRIPRYVRNVNDVPAARYMFFEICKNQTEPQRGVECPPTIETAGVFWPDELSELDELLS